MSKASIISARADLDVAQGKIKSEANATIREELTKLFQDPQVQTVGWSQKASEYNDEGMYPGVHGPYLNVEAPEETTSKYGTYQETPDWAYGSWRNEGTSSTNLKDLEEVLNAIDDVILSEIFGDSSYVIATRIPDTNEFDIESFDTNY